MAIAIEHDTTDAQTALLERGQRLARLEADLYPADRLDSGDAESDPALWGEEWDAHTWNLGPDPADDAPTAEDLSALHAWSEEVDARHHLDASERLTLAELTDRQIEFYRSWNNAAGEMFADALERLAVQIRLTRAATPDELSARVEILDAEVREQWVAAGYADGRASCQHEPAGTQFGHLA